MLGEGMVRGWLQIATVALVTIELTMIVSGATYGPTFEAACQ